MEVRTVRLRGAFDQDDIQMIYTALSLIEANKPDKLFTISLESTSALVQEAYESMSRIIGSHGGREIVMRKLARGEL